MTQRYAYALARVTIKTVETGLNDGSMSLEDAIAEIESVMVDTDYNLFLMDYLVYYMGEAGDDEGAEEVSIWRDDIREKIYETQGIDVGYDIELDYFWCFNEFEEKYPLSKSADIEKKFEWAKAACDYLEENFDAELIYKIRKECRCNDGKSIANKILKYLNKANSIEAFVASFNAKESFAKLEYISDNKILFCYPECYCACVKRVPQPLSMAWCYCTLGNAEGIFTEVFKKDVKVTLLESIKTGSDRCVIEVEW